MHADEDVECVLRAAVVASNAKVLSEAQGRPEREGMGATVTAMACACSRQVTVREVCRRIVEDDFVPPG